jgi:2-phosphosulfolactate phosphatase
MTEPEQPAFDTLFDWSAAGAVLLGRVCPVVVVVDVLRFTTAVEVGVARGAVVVPRRWAEGRGADPGPAPGSPPCSLSPASPLGVPPAPGWSWRRPNGATVALAAAGAGTVLDARGLAADLALAAEHDVSTTVPRLAGGAFAQLS